MTLCRTCRSAVAVSGLALLATAASPAQAQGNPSPEQAVAEVARQFGGAYDDPALQTYVASVGQLIVSTTPMANQKFTFTVLNSPIVNAFSMPGGYVFITRGLLALADNEAELAGVLGHEIGHVTAHHADQRQRRSTWAQLGAVGAGLLGAVLGKPQVGDIASEIVGVGGMAWVQKYSREQEYEADQLGIRYIGAAGYDPQAMASFLRNLEAETELENQLAGRPLGDQGFNMMADHPNTPDRVQRALAEARAERPHDAVDRDIYLKKIDGIVYGEDPRNGVVRNRIYYHPTLHLAFAVPPDFQVLNGETQVQGQGPSGAAFVFDRAPKPFNGSPEQYIGTVWAAGAASQIEPLQVNGLPAATALAQARTDSGNVAVRLAAIRIDPTTFYRFVFILPPSGAQQLDAVYRQTLSSFRRLPEAEAARIRPYRVRVVAVKPGDTVERLAARMPFDKLKAEHFLVLNGLEKGQRLQPSQLVKTVVEQ